jgi:hypothetical protein
MVSLKALAVIVLVWFVLLLVKPAIAVMLIFIGFLVFLVYLRVQRPPNQQIKPGNFFWETVHGVQWSPNQQIRQATSRNIPTNVKQYVWRRDGGRCVQCGSNERLEYDHIIPVSKGGSNTERNVQLLCEHCNRMKHAKIM